MIAHHCKPPPILYCCEEDKIAEAAGGAEVTLVAPTPKYVLAKCCSDENHITNFYTSDSDFDLQDGIGQQVGLLENWSTGHGVNICTTILASTTIFGPAVSVLSEQAAAEGDEVCSAQLTRTPERCSRSWRVHQTTEAMMIPPAPRWLSPRAVEAKKAAPRESPQPSPKRGGRGGYELLTAVLRSDQMDVVSAVQEGASGPAAVMEALGPTGAMALAAGLAEDGGGGGGEGHRGSRR